MKIKELMTPVSEYTTLKTDATLSDVVTALADSKHRDVFVVDEDGKCQGILTMTDIMLALEPNYKKILGKDSAHDILTHRLVSDLFAEYDLWDDTLAELCKKSLDTKAQKAMYVPGENEFLNEDDDLEQGVHRYIAGMHQPLIVRSNGTVTGVLRLADLFEEIRNRMLSCTAEL
ncbi:CBS domain-containing protein [uncultured Pseudodesulfovibrio sp.]|uniref:CBS domain-containing protein n=1 Tax=uncultured Pseudodesulfovibrio sp. TaxID=2035858 RepID=UPI0029C62B20|nr:CBS domain-containing protein [uncultured Pseudodesulfovibrio sp.]